MGHTIRAVVAASNVTGSAFATSAATTVVNRNLSLSPPANPKPRDVSGTPSAGLLLPHAPGFVGSSYYARFSHGPSSSTRFFPIYTYELNLAQWSQLPARIAAMGVNGVDDAYDQTDQSNFNVAAANRLRLNINGSIDGRSNSQVVTSYAMQDEPNGGTQYAASLCSPSNDTCGQAYVNDANAYRSADSTRPVWGNFTKDVMEWAGAPSGWTSAQFVQHNRAMIGALDIVSTDNYGWTDTYEWNQETGESSNDHFGAWIYGHAIARLNYYNPNIPAYGIVECCDSIDGNGNSTPTNEMMPGMLLSAVWNLVVHGARGYIYWTTDFWDSSSGGNPESRPYQGATYYGNYALYGDHLWDPQYAAAQQVNHQVAADAVDLNSPTVSGVSASSSSGIPVATLGKDVGGNLWLLAQADGDGDHPLSNTAPMTATISLPSTVPAGTVLDVVGENRTVTVNADHQITDSFGTTTETPAFSGKPITYGYQHHIYVTR